MEPGLGYRSRWTDIFSAEYCQSGVVGFLNRLCLIGDVDERQPTSGFRPGGTRIKGIQVNLEKPGKPDLDQGENSIIGCTMTRAN